jgi:uncharacterized membrane protein
MMEECSEVGMREKKRYYLYIMAMLTFYTGVTGDLYNRAAKREKSKDIAKVLIIGSGPIVIGQSAEFDYSGAQACKALKSEGYEVVLANSNPATIMTDPEMADRTYIEPLTRTYLEEIIRVEAEMLTADGRSGALRCCRRWADKPR